MTWCTVSVFSTAIMSSPCMPPMPSSAHAALASARRRSLKAGSVQALATTLAPGSGGSRWSTSGFSSGAGGAGRGGSGRLEVGLPHVEGHGPVRVGDLLPPQIGGAEQDGVDVLGVVTQAVAGAVGVDEGAVRLLDDARPAPDV